MRCAPPLTGSIPHRACRGAQSPTAPLLGAPSAPSWPSLRLRIRRLSAAAPQKRKRASMPKVNSESSSLTTTASLLTVGVLKRTLRARRRNLACGLLLTLAGMAGCDEPLQLLWSCTAQCQPEDTTSCQPEGGSGTGNTKEAAKARAEQAARSRAAPCVMKSCDISCDGKPTYH